MKQTLRFAALLAVMIAGLFAMPALSQAQVPVGPALGSAITARLTPTIVPYQPGTVPSQCLAYQVQVQPTVVLGQPVLAPPQLRWVVFCEEQFPTQWDVTVTLLFGGFKPPGFRTPDDCILRKSSIPGLFSEYCKGVHW